MSYLTLLDIAKRAGSDPLIGLIENVTTVAPELATLPVRPRAGTTYKYTLRTGRPAGGFRGANEGSTPGKSTFQQKIGQMFYFDGLMQVDEAIVKADDRAIGDILMDEGSGILEQTTVTIGDQIYRGTTADAKGFAGFRANVDSSMVVNAGGSGTVHNVWFLYANDRDGVHLPLGNNGSLDLGEWTKQLVSQDDDATKKFMAYVNNLSFYLGLHIPTTYSLGCIKNVTAANPWTDALSSELYAKFPIGKKPTHIFAGRDPLFYLQKSRSSIGNQKSNARGDAFAELPESSVGVTIVPSDSPATETAW